MAKNEKHRQLAENILTEVGGKENITHLVNCLTRLRFTFSDKSKVNVDAINNIPGVMGTQWQGDQFQVVIGQDVGDVYKEVCNLAGIEQQKMVDDQPEKKRKISAALFFDSISGCIAPILPLLIGAGLFRVVLMVAVKLGLDATGSTYTVLSYVGDAAFYFLPIFVGATGARKFGANIGYGMLIGAVLVFPGFIEAIGSGQALTLFGIPIYPASYSSSVFPMIMATYVLSHVERLITKISPKIVRSITVPFFTLLIMIPLTLIVIAPLGSIVGGFITTGILWLYNTTGFLGVGVMAGLYSVLCLTGMHTATLPAMLELFGTLGYEPIMLMSALLYTLNQGVVSLAVALRTKDTEIRSTALAASVSAFVAGISEPSLFGFTLKNRKLLYSSIVGCFAGGLYAGAMKVHAVAVPGSVGFMGVPAFVSSIQLLIAIGISFVVTFGLCFFFVLKKERETT